MAIELYSPADGAEVENPVVLTWEQNGTSNVWYNVGSWIELDSSEYSCANSVCTATLDLGFEATHSLRVWMNGESSQIVDFTTSAENTGGNGEVVVVLDTTELKAMLDEYFVVDSDLTGSILGQTVVLFAIGFGAAKVARILSRK